MDEAIDGVQVDLRGLRFSIENDSLNPRLGAEALVAAGIPRGPAVGAVLRALRDLRLDGRAESPADEERFVQRESARYRKGESR